MRTDCRKTDVSIESIAIEIPNLDNTNTNASTSISRTQQTINSNKNYNNNAKIWESFSG